MGVTDRGSEWGGEGDHREGAAGCDWFGDHVEPGVPTNRTHRTADSGQRTAGPDSSGKTITGVRQWTHTYRTARRRDSGQRTPDSEQRSGIGQQWQNDHRSQTMDTHVPDSQETRQRRPDSGQWTDRTADSGKRDRTADSGTGQWTRTALAKR